MILKIELKQSSNLPTVKFSLKHDATFEQLWFGLSVISFIKSSFKGDKSLFFNLLILMFLQEMIPIARPATNKNPLNEKR